MGVRGLLRTAFGGRFHFWCAGCRDMHTIDGGWKFDGNYERPTFVQSVLVTSGHYVSTHKPGDPCWCTYNNAHPEHRASFTCFRCHLFIHDGQVAFLSDCTHAMAGQTVPLTLPPDDLLGVD